MMKNIAILFVLIVWIFPLSAQRAKAPAVDLVKVWKAGDSLMVTLQIPLDRKLNGRNYKQFFTPVLYKDTVQMRMPEITVRTRRARILDARQEMSYGVVADAGGEVYQSGRDTLIDYSYSTLYQEWMEGSDFRLDRRVTGCCSDTVLDPVGLAKDLQLLPDTVRKALVVPESMLAEQLPRMVEQYVAADAAVKPVPRKWEFTDEDMIIYFKVNVTEIDFTVSENQRVLGEVVKAIKGIRKTPGMELNRIEVTGYASPEGKIANNQQLAGERAAALKKYIRELVPDLKEDDFALQNGGENWEGLRKLAAQSGVPFKNKVLYIIDNVPAEIDYVNNTSRKKQLMDLAGGVPYNYLKEMFFEKLRNACYISVHYDLALDPVAEKINQAIPLVKAQQFEEALEILRMVKEDPRAWNSMGVCYLFLGQYSEARAYLQKAATAGSELAKKNLLLIP